MPTSRTSPLVSRAVAGLVLLLSAPLLAAWNAAGTVKNTAGTALAGVTVSVSDTAAIHVVSGTDGSFSIGSTTGLLSDGLSTDRLSIRVEGNLVRVQGIPQGPVSLSLLDVDGRTLWTASTWGRDGLATAELPSRLPVGSHFLRVRHAEGVFYQGVVVGAQGLGLASRVQLARSLATYPVLKFQKAGYKDATYAMTAASQTGIVVTMSDTGGTTTDTAWVENHRSACTIPSFPAVSTLKDNAFLPDPFTMMDGTKVTTKAQWKCRREEMVAILEHYELGEKPAPPEKVTGSMSGSTLTITVTDKGKSIQFTVSITKPAGAGPFPAVIGYGGGSLGTSLSGMNVATINYLAADMFNASTAGQMAKDGSSYRGQGLFYDLYGSTNPAGAITAWAWGVSRIIDALAATPAAGIDAKHVAVTGCSRFGKGAFFAGVLDQRVALVIPQEGGSGGCSSYRAVAWAVSQGKDVEQLQNVAGGTNWYRSSFSTDFSNSTTAKLPFDHHWAIASVAPRGLLDIEQSGIAWLGPDGTLVGNYGGNEGFQALGVPEAHTFSLSGAHDHCSMPTTQYHWVQSYVKKYLMGQTGEAAKMELPSGYSFDRAKWINWTTPTLN
jgi:hypothetical protein